MSDTLAPRLHRRSAVPLYRQLHGALRDAIHDGLLPPGFRLPSSRDLADQLAVGRVTVTTAYAELVAEGLVASGVGSGTFVCGPARPAAMPVRSGVSGDAAPRLSARARAILDVPAGLQPYEGAFVPGVCDVRQFPFAAWRRLLTRSLRADQFSLMGYANQGGFLPLRRAIAHYLNASRGVRCAPDQVLITAGTNQSIELCARLLADHGDPVAVENPCHWGTRAVLIASGLVPHPMGVDEQGVRLELAGMVRPPRLLCITPSNQFPLGTVLSAQRRRELLDASTRHDFHIVEDDYDCEFRYDGEAPAALQGQDADGRVIYLGTFSKVMYPGLRLSYLVAPPPLVGPFTDALVRLYRPGHLLVQAAMADFISEGHFAAHIRTMRSVYAERQAELDRRLRAEFGSEVAFTGGRAGLHLTTSFPRLETLDRLEQAATRRQLMLRRLKLFDFGSSGVPLDGFLLGYGGVPVEEIAPAVRRLAEAYDEAA